MYGTYRYAELSSYNIALISETQKLTKEKDRLYSIRHDIQKLTNGSIAELRKKFPQLAINCTTDPQ
jgi:CII-binding regulator of phage lambda lysogenization HflD